MKINNDTVKLKRQLFGTVYSSKHESSEHEKVVTKFLQGSVMTKTTLGELAIHSLIANVL